LWRNIYTWEKIEHTILCEAIPGDYDLNFDQRGEQKVQLAGRNGLRRVQLLSGNRVISFSLRSGRGGMP
jgi:hypothetical protein